MPPDEAGLTTPRAGPPAPNLRLHTARGRWVVAASVLGAGIVMIDGTVVNVALPAIGHTFHSGLATLQWTVTAYTLTLAAFILVGGSIGDRYGRRRSFIIGVLWFAAASLVCGLAPSAGVLILARALQGVGAALLTPESLAILQATFRPEDRAQAIGTWSGLERHRRGRRAVHRRLPHPGVLLAADLSHQPAAGRDGRLDRPPARAGDERPDRRRAARRRRREPCHAWASARSSTGSSGAATAAGRRRWCSPHSRSRLWPRRASWSSSAAWRTLCCPSTSSAPGSSRAPTSSPSRSTAPWAVRCSCCRSSSSRCWGTRRSRRAPRFCRSRSSCWPCRPGPASCRSASVRACR